MKKWTQKEKMNREIYEIDEHFHFLGWEIFIVDLENKFDFISCFSV